MSGHAVRSAIIVRGKAQKIVRMNTTNIILTGKPLTDENIYRVNYNLQPYHNRRLKTVNRATISVHFPLSHILQSHT